MKITSLSISLLFISFGLFAQTQVWRHSDTLGGIFSAQNIFIDVNANVYAGGPSVDSLDQYGVPSAAIVFKLDSSGGYHWNQGFIGTENVAYFGMAGDNVGNSYVYGEYNNSQDFSAYMTRVDSTGNIAWTELHNYAGVYDAYNNAMVDKDGNILVAGTSDDALGDQELVSLKYSPADTTPVFSKRYVETSSFYNSYFAQTDNAGGMYNIGQAAFTDYGNSIVLLKYNSFGTFIWLSILNSTAYSDEEPASSNADSLGNLYIVDNSAPQLENLNYVPLLIKINKGEQILWENLFGDTTNNYNLTSSALDTSFLYIAGSRNDSIYLAKITADSGHLVWTYTFDSGTINKVILKNGAIYVTGTINSNGGDFYTAKISANGYKLWDVTYNDALNGLDRANDLVADNSGNIYVAGQSFEKAGSRGSATVIRYHDNIDTCTLAIDSMATINASTNISHDGTAIAVVSGGTPPYGYSWSTGGTTDTIAGIKSNLYCVTVTDIHSCIAILCDSVRASSYVCNLSIDSVVATNVTPCYGGSNGIIAVYASGTIGNPSFSIDNGAHYQPGYEFYDLNVGTYTIKVKDEFNCTALYSGNPVTITQPFADTPTITIKGDTLSTGLYLEYEWLFNGNPVDTNQTYIADSEGVVQVYVLDVNGCIYASDSITFGIECNLVIDSVSATEVAPCYGGGNGAITVYASGGIGAVSYSINNGIDFQSSDFFGKLLPGNHIVEVKDANNCTAFYSGNPVTITQPAADTPSIVFTNDTFTAGQYAHYYWYYLDSIVDSSQFLVINANSLCGYISVQVTDSNRCSFHSDSILNACEGINSLSDSKIGLTIYPNPFGEYFNVQLQGVLNNEVEVQLFDMLGRKMYDAKPAGNTFSIYTATLAQGMYMLRVQVGEQFLYRQVVKTSN